MNSSSEHWNVLYSRTDDPQLGWYEKDPAPTLKLLTQIPDWEKATIFLPGAGTSLLIETLLAKGAHLLVNDISREALNRVKVRLPESNRITWLCQDISHPLPDTLPPVDIWIDRAVLHFLTAEADILGYFENLKTLLKPGGYALFAEFSPDGAPKCAGLTLHRYSLEELSDRLGRSYKLVSHFDHVYTNPNGDPRPYIYALFTREN